MARWNLRLGSLLFLVLVAPVVTAQDQAARRKIVIVAGLKSHGPEGNGIHDYAWSARLLKTMLENSNIAESIEIVTYLNGWPGETAVLDDASAIMVISDGRDGENGREALHLATPQRVEQVQELASRGTGIVVFHFATFAPDSLSEQVFDWYGGYFDWETNGKREWYSDITTIEATVSPASPEHEILRGVQAFELEEEFYFNMRFREQDPRMIPIWRVDDLPKTQENGNVVAWAVQRENGGRGFATTCGHFYENWKNRNFRVTMLNAIAWAAHVEIPKSGVESRFYSHDEIAAHLQLAELVEADEVASADDTAYSDDPYWYKPGHPLQPAEPRSISTLPGFQVEKIYSVPEAFGSWTAITVDHQGRLICSAQHKPGLYRIELESTSSDVVVERLEKSAARIGWCHGLLYAFDSLYVTVAEGNDSVSGGVYRLRDLDGDDQYETLDQLLEFNTAGEHGPHNIVIGPDRKSLYIICGNGTTVPDGIERYRPSRTEGNDHLMPSGFGESEYTSGGFVMKFAPDGTQKEIICSGLRNSFDLAFNRVGDLFTFDSDMEWDLGAPWYRPTRICHLVSGGEFGWRQDAAKWPEYYEDSVRPVVNIGPASPTGVVFGYEARFPERYRHALFACDWTFATIHAIHLEPFGSSYTARVEEFIGGSGLPVTDLVIGADGNMYFVVGGRRLGSALYRVKYQGGESSSDSVDVANDSEVEKQVKLRRALEQLHGVKSETAVDFAWPHLGNADRGIRFAARVAIESQPVSEWRQRVYDEAHADTKRIGLLALARQEEDQKLHQIVDHAVTENLRSLNDEQLMQTLRVLELSLARGGSGMKREHERIAQALLPLFPSHKVPVDRELVRLLCNVRSVDSIDTILAHMRQDIGELPTLGGAYFVRNPKYGQAMRDMLVSAPLVNRMHDAQMLLWVDEGWSTKQRHEYFQLIADASVSSKGGYWYREFWERIRENALRPLNESERETYVAIGSRSMMGPDETLPTPKGPGKPWTLEEILDVLADRFHDRDHADGEKMFSAAKCVTCHRFNGQGSSIGPDLSSIGQRFTLRDLLDSTISPNKAISDQYRVHMILQGDGQTVFGRLVARDDQRVIIAPNLNRPSQTIAIAVADIEQEKPVDVSTMPGELLNQLNMDEILNLLAYLVAGGDANHPVFKREAH